MNPTHIEDAEELYRRVPDAPLNFHEQDGKVIVSVSAFNDRKREPSVDRAEMIGRNPELTQSSGSDGVVLIVANEVRAIDKVQKKDGERIVEQYNVDVRHDPIHADPAQGIKENLAHAVVYATPEIASDSVFRRLKEALSLLANKRGWLIYPESMRS